MILLIDNYDSFSYNLVQLIGETLLELNSDEEIRVYRNDEITLKEIHTLSPSHIILSPGPGRPSEAGICEQVVKEMMATTPILGVCLGHQAICEAFGAEITFAKTLMHGKQSLIKLSKNTIFNGLNTQINVARYHSLVADIKTIPECLDIIATANDGEIMAVKHQKYNVYGLQFHPESVLTKDGKTMIMNFLQIKGGQYND